MRQRQVKEYKQGEFYVYFRGAYYSGETVTAERMKDAKVIFGMKHCPVYSERALTYIAAEKIPV